MDDMEVTQIEFTPVQIASFIAALKRVQFGEEERVTVLGADDNPIVTFTMLESMAFSEN